MARAMVATISSELQLPISYSILPLVRSHVRELATLVSLPLDKSEALERSVLEACTNIIKHAFEPGEADTFGLRTVVTSSALTVSLFDYGMRFDHNLAPPCLLPPGPKGAVGGPSSSGLCLIRNLVDRMEWINHGRAGKELRLTLYNVTSNIVRQSNEGQLVPFRQDERPSQDQSYLIRQMRSEDAAWVSRLVFRAYGYTYPIEDLYYPDRIVSLNEVGKLFSVVAESASGEIVGYCALKRPTPGPVAEVGQAVVNRAHRGRKLLERMHAVLEKEALKLGVTGLAAFSVTGHVFSQKSSESLGSKVCGLLLGLLPHTVVFRELRDEPPPQRESCLLYFKYLKPPGMSRICAPERHHEILRRIYDQLEIPVEFKHPGPVDGAGLIEVHANSALGVGEIFVKQIGTETVAEVRQARRDLCDLAGAAAIYLQVPLSQSGAPELCHLVEQEGFFFSALYPGFAEDGDGLRMQYLNTQIDFSRLQLNHSRARELLRYVEQERARVGQSDSCERSARGTS
jgi:anti-sigma regulatory factor (Ser/Thr protein kinase)